MLARVSPNPRLRGFIAAAVTVCALAMPATASAANYMVNDIGDEPDAVPGVAGCLTGGAVCSLRAAIEESNLSGAIDDTITFNPMVFEGQLGDTIVLGAGFPAITDKVTIDGDNAAQCMTAAGPAGPCVGVSGPAAGPGLVVNNADEVTIEGLAVTGVTTGTGINVINSSEKFVALNNWIGIKLDGSAGANRTGIFLDPNSNLATIGGTTAPSRNVFGNNEFEGLDIQGASNAKVAGNYFGVRPDGMMPASNGKDIEVTSSASIEAAGNEIGTTIAGGALTTAACDGGCNVITGNSSYWIDMYGEGGGEEPPAKTTKIHGNYIGLNAPGTATVFAATFGIWAGKSKETTIGGPAAGDANLINGSGFGIYASGGGNEGAPKLIIQGNMFGLNPAGTAVLSPSGTGVFNSSENGIGAGETAKILENRFAAEGGIAIDQHSVGALIKGNILGRGTGGENLSAGATGIKLRGSFGGSTVESNVINGAEGNAVLIENENNELTGNTIEGSGAAAIRVQRFGGVLPSSGNQIGGDAANEENQISGSGGDAIEIVEDENDNEQIKRNFGSGNGGLFIDLVGKNGPGNEASGPNAGIEAPTIAKATTAGISGGGALPNADIRVFEKATASPGEIKGFLGQAKADGSGNWEVKYGSKIAGSTNVGATQSDVEGTSELALGVTEADKPGGSGEGKGGGGNVGGNGKDTTPPETKILKKPKAKPTSPKRKFKFSSSEQGSSFECKLDKKPFKPCKSPKKYKKLKPGKHVFKVRAIDAAGNVDPTPAKKKFKVFS